MMNLTFIKIGLIFGAGFLTGFCTVAHGVICIVNAIAKTGKVVIDI